MAMSLGLWSTAFAHAHLVSSVPAAGARLTAAPTKVTLVFSEEVSEQESDTFFSVSDSKGTKVGSGKLDNTDVDHKTQSGTLQSNLGDRRRWTPNECRGRRTRSDCRPDNGSNNGSHSCGDARSSTNHGGDCCGGNCSTNQRCTANGDCKRCNNASPHGR